MKSGVGLILRGWRIIAQSVVRRLQSAGSVSLGRCGGLCSMARHDSEVERRLCFFLEDIP